MHEPQGSPRPLLGGNVLNGPVSLCGLPASITCLLTPAPNATLCNTVGHKRRLPSGMTCIIQVSGAKRQ